MAILWMPLERHSDGRISISNLEYVYLHVSGFTGLVFLVSLAKFSEASLAG